jgi:hypothetical protein
MDRFAPRVAWLVGSNSNSQQGMSHYSNMISMVSLKFLSQNDTKAPKNTKSAAVVVYVTEKRELVNAFQGLGLQMVRALLATVVIVDIQKVSAVLWKMLWHVSPSGLANSVD